METKQLILLKQKFWSYVQEAMHIYNYKFNFKGQEHAFVKEYKYLGIYVNSLKNKENNI